MAPHTDVLPSNVSARIADRLDKISPLAQAILADLREFDCSFLAVEVGSAKLVISSHDVAISGQTVPPIESETSLV